MFKYTFIHVDTEHYGFVVRKFCFLSFISTK